MVGPCILTSLPPTPHPSITCMHYPSHLHQQGSSWWGQTTTHNARVLYSHDQPSVTSHHRFCRHQKLFITTKIATSLLAYHTSPQNLPPTYLHVIHHHQNFCQPIYMSFVITKIFTNLFTYYLSQKFLPAYLHVILHLQNCYQPIYMPFLTYKIAAGLIGHCLLPPKLLASLAVSLIIDESASV